MTLADYLHHHPWWTLVYLLTILFWTRVRPG